MSECITSAKCSEQEYQMAREAGLLVVSVADEIAIHKFAELVRAAALEEGYRAGIEFVASGSAA